MRIATNEGVLSKHAYPYPFIERVWYANWSSYKQGDEDNDSD